MHVPVLPIPGMQYVEPHCAWSLYKSPSGWLHLHPSTETAQFEARVLAVEFRDYTLIFGRDIT